MSSKSVEDRFENRQNTIVMSMSLCITGGRSSFGKYKSCTPSDLFSKLIIIKSVPPRSYSYHVRPELIATSIQFLQVQHPVISDLTRNVKVNSHLFQNLPVYSSGGHSLMELFESCYRVLDISDRIGRAGFLRISQMLRKKVEIRDGLSSYYVPLRTIDDTLYFML